MLKKENPRPNIHIVADRLAKYDEVAEVLSAFQQAGYGPHFGFVGIDRGK
jgi:biopolymer transport protein ExbD